MVLVHVVEKTSFDASLREDALTLLPDVIMHVESIGASHFESYDPPAKGSKAVTTYMGRDAVHTSSYTFLRCRSPRPS